MTSVDLTLYRVTRKKVDLFSGVFEENLGQNVMNSGIPEEIEHQIYKSFHQKYCPKLYPPTKGSLQNDI